MSVASLYEDDHDESEYMAHDEVAFILPCDLRYVRTGPAAGPITNMDDDVA